MKKMWIILIAIFIVIVLFFTVIVVIQNPINPCKQNVKAEGYCEMIVIGYEFNSALDRCIEIKTSGCSIKGGFKTLGECQETCEKKR